jgi:hypothetical protein
VTLNEQVEENFNKTVRDIISATNGVTTEGNYDYKVEYVTDTLDKMAFLPIAAINGLAQGYVDMPVNLSGGDSYDPDSSIKEYAWDCDNDGVWDFISPNPSAECAYDQPYSGLIVLEVRSEDGGSAKAIQNISVTNQVAKQSVPPQPIATAARSGDNVSLVWQNNYQSDVYVRVLDSNDNVLEVVFGANDYLVKNASQNGFILKLLACNEVGCSEPATLQIPEVVTQKDQPQITSQNIIQSPSSITPTSQTAAANSISQPVANNTVLTSVEGAKTMSADQNIATQQDKNDDQGNANKIIDAVIILIIALGLPWLIMKRFRLRR